MNDSPLQWLRIPFQIGLLAAIWFLADCAVRYFHLPLPANVTGMLALLALILLGMSVFSIVGAVGGYFGVKLGWRVRIAWKRRGRR